MFEFIHGILRDKRATSVVIENNGVGYILTIPLSTYDSLGMVDTECTLYVHSVIRDTEFQLFGFFSHQEREAFRAFIKVSGIGPKMALSMLSGLPLAQLVGAITAQDASFLTTIPGIGKKTAERIIVELKDNFEGFETMLSEGDKKAASSFATEAENALIALGYTKNDVKRSIASCLEKNAVSSAENIVRIVLRELYAKKR